MRQVRCGARTRGSALLAALATLALLGGLVAAAHGVASRERRATADATLGARAMDVAEQALAEAVLIATDSLPEAAAGVVEPLAIASGAARPGEEVTLRARAIALGAGSWLVVADASVRRGGRQAARRVSLLLAPAAITWRPPAALVARDAVTLAGATSLAGDDAGGAVGAAGAACAPATVAGLARGAAAARSVEAGVAIDGAPPELVGGAVDVPVPMRAALAAVAVGGGAAVTHVRGDHEVTADEAGQGTLLVDGRLLVRGRLAFEGLVIAGGVDVEGTLQVVGAVVASEARLAPRAGAVARVQWDGCAVARALASPRVLAPARDRAWLQQH